MAKQPETSLVTTYAMNASKSVAKKQRTTKNSKQREFTAFC